MDVLFSRLHWIMVTRLKAPPVIDCQNMLVDGLNEPGPAETGLYPSRTYITFLDISEEVDSLPQRYAQEATHVKKARAPAWAQDRRAERALFLAIYDVFDRVFRVIEALLKSRIQCMVWYGVLVFCTQLNTFSALRLHVHIYLPQMCLQVPVTQLFQISSLLPGQYKVYPHN